MDHSEGRTIELESTAMRSIFGGYDAYLKLIESALHVEIVARRDVVHILGKEGDIAKAERLLSQLAALSERGTPITEQTVTYTLSLLAEEKEGAVVEMDKDTIVHTAQGRPVKPKTVGQKAYADLIRGKMITFGIGPAGTGKTYLAMAMAIRSLREEEVQRIILTRPALEAGEKLGFLPGDLQSKIDPYLRPLYDALYEIMGAETFARNLEKGLIEVAPLAYMRGRTLDHSFIILDEAQNTTPAQMKMFLTRIGFGSKAVITGDRTQKDLPKDVPSGLDVAVKVLSGIDDIGFITLTAKDVVRHPLVQKIVDAYDKYEEKTQRQAKAKTVRKKKG